MLQLISSPYTRFAKVLVSISHPDGPDLTEQGEGSRSCAEDPGHLQRVSEFASKLAL